jgi:transcriptional regulator GlxA family with amidase domain
LGTTPREYITHVRLERANMLLAVTAMPISDIAHATGFVHHRNFTSRFRAATGLSPREFRRDAQAMNVTADGSS